MGDAVADVGSAAVAGVVAPGRLLEPEREVAALDAAIGAAVAGRAGVVLVEGPAGIGKTRLLAEARTRAAGAGVTVLAARGGGLERAFSFGVVRQPREAPGFDPYRWGRFDWVRTLVLNITLAQPLVQQYAELCRGRDDDELGALADSFVFANCGVRETLRDQLARS